MMRAPVKSWLVIALIAAGVAACTSRGVAPIPALQPDLTTTAAASDDDAAAPDDAAPDARGCAKPRFQPAWIFLGPCRTQIVRAAGANVRLQLYRGYTALLTIPKNNARRGDRITLVDATGARDVRRNKGKAFPLNGKAFLYLQTVNRARPIVFAKGEKLKLTIRARESFVASQCGVDVRGDALRGGWRALPGATGTTSGDTLVISIPSLGRLPKGVVYYSITCTANVSPSPSASASSSPTSSPTALPAYCSNYTIPSTATVPLNITDDSGLGDVLLVYITNGTSFMDDSGNFDDSDANPYPAGCFSTTTGSRGNVALKLPKGISAGRIYFAYATPVPGHPGTVPNPMSGVTVAGPGFGYGLSPYPYDKIEYGLTAGATIDTTQVDALGLPLELSVTGTLPPQTARQTSDAHADRRQHALPTPCATSAPGIVGVTSCNFQNIFTQMKGIVPYNQLVLAQPFGGKTIDMQIVAPQNASGLGFQLNLFALQSFAPSASVCNGVTETYGYLSCVLSSYQTSPRFYASSTVGGVVASGDNYCAGSDGASNFIFTDIGSGPSCAGSPTPKPSSTTITMPIAEFTYGVPPGSSGCTQNLLFGLPWGLAQVGAGQIFATNDAFAMWKALEVDLNRGVALSTSTHPVGGSTPTMGDFFKDPLQNEYAYLMHYYFNQNLAYALAFDDSGNFESGVIWQPGDPINVRVNAIPTAAPYPSAQSTPLPVPNPCNPLPTNVGG